MSSGLFPNMELVERFQASVTAANLAQPFIAPCDLEVVGLALYCGTAPGAGDGVSVNVSDSPTSQLVSVSAYNLWTAANVPTVLGALKSNLTAVATPVVIENRPYAPNYPIPGPAGSQGYATAQSSSLITSNPVVTPPTQIQYGVTALVAPDNTYTDLNGFTSTPAKIVHAGDVLTFVVTAAAGGLGAVGNLEVVLYCAKN